MARNTVIGVFDNYEDAQSAASQLALVGISRANVEISTTEDTTATAGGTPAGTAAHDESFGERIAHFFSSLFGGDDDRADAGDYSEAVRRGHAVVTVEAANPEEADRAADKLNECGAIDIQDRSRAWRDSGATTSAGGAEALTGSAAGQFSSGKDEQVIPVVSEDVQVGKRRRERGGVRIYTHMDESPVEEQVNLREERVKVDRRPVDRPASEADVSAFKDQTIEVHESVEEPVVAKRARVVEEVVIGKEARERTETIAERVKHGEVDVERLDEGAAASGAAPSETYDEYDADYRTHWQSTYGTSGGEYERYVPAYRYGSSLGDNERYRGRAWDDIEPDARRDWETRYPGGAWDRFKGAVRHGWERVTGKR